MFSYVKNEYKKLNEIEKYMLLIVISTLILLILGT